MSICGTPTLRNLCISLLVEFRDCLEDIGDTPLELLHPILVRCNAEQLASIEDGSRDGGRNLHDALQPHWQRVFINKFGWDNEQLVLAFRLSSFSIAAEDWRQLYDFAEKAHREKAAELGGRLRAMTQAEQKSRQTRHVEMIAPTRAFAEQKASQQPSGTRKQKFAVPARQRILSKLGLLHDKSLKHLVRIRPARAVPFQSARSMRSSKQPPAKQLQGFAQSSQQSPAKQPQGSVQSNQQSSAKQSQGFASASVNPAKGRPALQNNASALPSRHPEFQQHGWNMRDADHPTVRYGTSGWQDCSGVAADNTQAHSGLIEADIDWRPGKASSQLDNLAQQPEAAQPWTVQYLEQYEADNMLGHDQRNMPNLRHTDSDVVDADRGPTQQGSFAWVEDDIPW